MVFSTKCLLPIAIITLVAKASASTVTFEGLQWESLGQAQLSVAADGLHVTNIGATGNDGVRLLLPLEANPTNTDAFISGFDLSGLSSPVGAFFQYTYRGTLNGTPDRVLETFTAETINSGVISFEADMSPIAPTSLTTVYFSGGTPVHTETDIPDGSYLAGNTVTPHDWGGWTWVFDVPLRTFDGVTVAADALVVKPVSSEAAIGGPFSIDYTGAQIDSFLVEHVAIPEPPALTWVPAGLAFLFLRRAVRRSTSVA